MCFKKHLSAFQYMVAYLYQGCRDQSAVKSFLLAHKDIVEHNFNMPSNLATFMHLSADANS